MVATGPLTSPRLETTRRAIVRGLTGTVVAGGIVSGCRSASTSPTTVRVWAAASLRDALETLAARIGPRLGLEIATTFAASGAVARQVQAGAPADIVILADPAWMDRLAAGGRIDPAGRIDLLTNRLIVIAPTDREIEPDPLAWLLEAPNRRLAIGEPSSVPAGAYAQAWLRSRGYWPRIQSRVVTAVDVRGVRAFVARGEADLGIVYRSDLIGAAGIKAVLEPPSVEQPAIVYPAALSAGAGSRAAEVLDALQSPRADAVFEQYGFGVRARD